MRCLAPLLTGILWSTGAEAAGYYFVGEGTRAMSRGGAWVAGVDDLSAQWHNPAALIRLEAPQAYVNLSMIRQDVSFAPTSPASSTPATNIDSPMVIPAWGIGAPLGDKAAVAFGLFPPASPDLGYDPDGPQRYTLIDALIWQINLGPSLAVRVHDKLTIGVGIIGSYVRAEESLAIAVCNSMNSSAPGDPNFDQGCHIDADPNQVDLIVEMEMVDPFTLNGVLGLLFSPTDDTHLGLTVLPPMRVGGQGTLTATFSDAHWLDSFLGSHTMTDEAVSVGLTMPLIIRGGLSHQLLPELEIELAGAWERWSDHEDISVTDVHLELPVSSGLPTDDLAITDDIVLPARYQPAWSIRLGGSWTVSDVLELHGGTFHERSAIPSSMQGVSLVDGNKTGVGLGMTWDASDRVAVDIGGLASWFAPQDVRDSVLPQFHVPVDLSEVLLGTEPVLGEGAIVGNGRYEATVTMASLGLSYRFR
jgi:long-chain fatty acid transport protein